MTIPHQREIGLPILEFLKDKKVHHISEMAKHLENYFELSEDERRQQKSSGHEGLFHNRIRWANFNLRKAELIESASGTGKSKITKAGIKLLKEKPEIIDMKYLMRFTVYAEYRESVFKKKK